MKILILVFSPAGSTMKISTILKERLEVLDHEVQLLDITGNKSIFKDNNPTELFSETVKKHDLICIGSPVYEKHLEYYVGRFMKQLPKPDSTWGKFAISFVTYGGISSGFALKESISILKKTGRKTIGAMKLESSHIKCNKLKTRVNEEMPGDEANIHINDLISVINNFKLDDEKTKSIKTKVLNSHGFREKLLCNLMNERIMHRYKYPNLKIVESKCNSCLACVEACPIQRIDIVQAKPIMTSTLPECIHCFACVNICPNDSITFESEEEGWADIDRIYGFVSKPDSFIRSKESPKSKVYSTNI